MPICSQFDLQYNEFTRHYFAISADISLCFVKHIDYSSPTLSIVSCPIVCTLQSFIVTLFHIINIRNKVY